MTQTLTPTQIEFAGRILDLGKALPLRMRDHRALLRRGVSADKAIESGDIEALFQLMLYILQQADSAVTEAELEDLTPEAFIALWTRLAEVNKAGQEADRPFESSSTSSDVPSIGVPSPS